MKKKIIRTFASIIVISAMVLPGCDFLQDCGSCELVTDDGTNITYGVSRVYCDDDFLDRLYSSPNTDEFGVTTYWNCY